jgi:elongation factor G
MMEVEVTAPAEYLGAVLGSLSSRRGSVKSMDDRHGAKVIIVDVPLSEMFGYTTVLRSATQGRGSSSMQLKCYTEVPLSERKKMLEKV